MNFSKLNVIVIISIISLYSCESNLEDKQVKKANNIINDLQLINGTVKIENKTALKNIFKTYKKSIEGQNNFNDQIRDMQNRGFRPLTPIFSENDDEKINEFVNAKRKRITKRNIEFGITSKSLSNDEEINLDDEVVADPSLSALLNENREIYVGDSLYKYTETGLYFCLAKDKQKLYDYLNEMTVSTRRQIVSKITQDKTQSSKLTSKIEPEITQVTNGIMKFIPSPINNSGLGGISFPLPTFSVAPPYISKTPRLTKQTLEIAYVETNSLFERIFGASDKSEDYYSDNRRIQVSFWNQNYYLFSSVGCSARLQKREKKLGISYWEKSYADQIELGINNIQYDYKFNVPAFNNSLYVTGPTVYYSYKGVNYNQFAQVIPTLPTANPGFPFDTDNNQNVVEIYIFQNQINLSASDANRMIDDGLRALSKLLPTNNPHKNELIKGLDSEVLKYNIVKAVPFSNKVTFATMGVKWNNNNDNAITHYFDFNFLLTWKNSYTKATDYLSGLKGSTPYTSVYADIYGAALHNGEWRGRRLIREKH